MYDALKEAKVLAYTSLGRPMLDYADVIWYLATKNKVRDIELIQNSIMLFISNLKGSIDSVFQARNELGLRLLEDRRKCYRLCLLT